MMLKCSVLLVIVSTVVDARSLSQYGAVSNIAYGDFNNSVFAPGNQGLTDETGDQTFFASPGLGFANAFLLTAVTNQASDSFDLFTRGSQQVNAGSGVSIIQAGSTGFANGTVDLTGPDAVANITQFSRQDSQAEASNTTIGEGISTGQFASFGLLVNGTGLGTITGSDSDARLAIANFNLDSEASVTGGTTVDGPTTRTVEQGSTGVIVNPSLVTSQCSGQEIGQVVDGKITQASDCVLRVTFGV
eukprot:TRINITY_DN171_c0_g1_i1.p1 TRINITY_DN171_c0_g1~~TRINITY_DN171_c0_g1_i1.p1  ORF type:complete len:246 (+),score=47.09 TRINITY_DN171_c0_g1_i1:151-888(+)